MAEKCSHCNSSTLWDDDVGSAVCTSCGSLADPSQSVLTSSQYGNQNDTAGPSLWDASASTTLKSLRAGTQWDLAGQGKESRDRKNAYAMADFIKSLAVSLNAAGLSPRAVTLFTQAKSASNFRWGQKSRSVAAACLAIALRESNRPDSIRDIAAILNVPRTSVSREFTTITSKLKLSLTLVDPSVHISTLQNCIASTLQGCPTACQLPTSLVKSLQGLCLRSVAKTATTLGQVVTRFSPNHNVLRLPVPPTACGIFILALEAENRALLNPLGDLAQLLGSQCHAAKSVVMERYKTIQDEIACWIERVPWLDKFDSKNGRAKVSKRLVVARGLKDVIKFQEDIWQSRIRPLLGRDLGDDEDGMEQQHISSENTSSLKRSKMNNALMQTALFLLDPIGRSVSDMSSHKDNRSLIPTERGHELPLATYILTNPPTSLIRRPPTRLQLLAQDRGGTSEEHIPDDELFADGEFERLLRTDNEIQTLRTIYGWDANDGSEEVSPSNTTSPPRKTRKKRPREGTTVSEERSTDEFDSRPKKKSRINMEALAQFLARDNTPSDESSQESNDAGILGLEGVIYGYGLDSNSDEDNESHKDGSDQAQIVLEEESFMQHRKGKNKQHIFDNEADDEVVIEGWRPPSPDQPRGMDLQFEEEYD